MFYILYKIFAKENYVSSNFGLTLRFETKLVILELGLARPKFKFDGVLGGG